MYPVLQICNSFYVAMEFANHLFIVVFPQMEFTVRHIRLQYDVPYSIHHTEIPKTDFLNNLCLSRRGRSFVLSNVNSQHELTLSL